MNSRKFKKNAKALSPVIASIILIAVTVAVSVVVAAWMGGISLGFMAKTEQASIINVQFATNYVNATVLNSGTGSVTFSTATIDGNTATLAATGTGGSLTLAKGTTGYYTVTLASGTFTSGTQYTFKITTAKGTGLVYTATAP